MTVKIQNRGEDSLKKRYYSKLIANLVGLVVGLFTQCVIPRGLGPVGYGNFYFLTNVAKKVFGFSPGTQNAFYVKLSQRPKDQKLITFYMYISIIAGLSIIFFLIVVFVISQKENIFPGQQWLYIYLAFFLVFWTWFSKVISRIMDARVLTVKAEKVRIWQKGFAFGIISFLFLLGWLDLRTFFFYHYFLLAFICLGWIRILRNNDLCFWRQWHLKWEEVRGYVREFYDYCHPMVISALVGSFVGIFDLMLLQKLGGSVQQGFYALSMRISTLCILFIGPISSLLIREFSVSVWEKDQNHMAFLYKHLFPKLYALVAFFVCFIVFHGEDVTTFLGGSSFKEAKLAVTVMAVYPMHQAYGRLNNAILFATGQMALKRNITIMQSLVGLPVSYLLMAPRELFGLNLGATGLALKMVLIQVIFVNILIYFNTKFLKLSFWHYVRHQILCTSCLLTASMISVYMANQVFGLGGQGILSFFLSGAIFASLAALLVYLAPSVFGLNRQDIRTLTKRLSNFRLGSCT